jgi:hypothetical protein
MPTSYADFCECFAWKAPVETFPENHIINSVAELTLDVTPSQSVPDDQRVFKNYLAVCTVKVDSTRTRATEEKGFYSSSLALYQIGKDQV